MTARRLLIGLIIAVVAALDGALIAMNHADSSRISQTNTQVTQLQRKVADLTAGLAAVSAKSNGDHRDLITCGDLNYVLSNGNGINQDLATLWTNTIGGGIGILPGLPAHCINR